jgi:putative membrane protein
MENLYLNFLAHAGTALGILAVIIVVVELFTRNNLFKLIKAGNVSAGIVLTGKLIGSAITMAFVISNSVDLLDMIIWSVIGLAAQIIAFFLYEVLTPKFSVYQAIEDNNISAAIVSLGISMAVGLVIGGCVTN